MRPAFAAALLLSGAAVPVTAIAQPRQSTEQQLAEAMRLIAEQQARLEIQDARLSRLEADLRAQRTDLAAAPSPAQRPAPAVGAAQVSGSTVAGDPATIQQAPLERVGVAPKDADRPIELAVLDGQGSVVTRRGQLTGEVQFEYARADRNRAVFRGIELVESILVGVFDINESRQDVLTAAAALRYGVTDRLEFGVRVPFIKRSDQSIVAPIVGSTNNDSAATIDNSVNNSGIGDVEVSARYQITDGRKGLPYLIANLQGVLTTGTDPFSVPRDDIGRALKAATGAGFFGISPSVTAILPSDPVVLFGTLGYTFNLPRHVNTRIPPVIIDYVNPGDAISASAGIGISFNQRATLNLGYAHNWAFGTQTRTMLIMPTADWPGLRSSRSRDLQIGRLLFGVTYRVTDTTSLNWSVEAGATDDATDLRTTLRVPMVLLTGR